MKILERIACGSLVALNLTLIIMIVQLLKWRSLYLLIVPVVLYGLGWLAEYVIDNF